MRKTPQVRLTHKRAEFGFYLFGGLFLLLAGKVAWMQLVSNASATALSDQNFEKTRVLPARRGPILAADNTAIAVTVDEYTVAANPRAYKTADKEKLADILAKTLKTDRDAIRAKLDEVSYSNGRKKFYVKLAQHVNEDQAQALRRLMGKQKNEKRAEREARKLFWSNVSLEASPRRHYPLGAFAPQLIGFTTNSGRGADGMEKAFDDIVGGRSGIRESLVDAQGRAVPGR